MNLCIGCKHRKGNRPKNRAEDFPCAHPGVVLPEPPWVQPGYALALAYGKYRELLNLKFERHSWEVTNCIGRENNGKRD
jgi:hypothetical protein